MTLPFKAVAVDMDGTFLNDQRSYDHQLFDKVLSQLEEKNIHFIVASGRPYARLKEDFADFHQRMDFVTCNGARIMSNDQELGLQGLSKQEVLQVVGHFYAKYGEVATLIYGPEQAYVNANADQESKDFLAYFGHNVVELSSWDQLPDDTFIELTFHHDSSVCAKFEEEVNSKYGDLITGFASNEIAIDVVKKGVSKASGLTDLLAKFDLTGHDLIAFGDNGNDIPMLDLADYSYCMENGTQAAKNHAKFVAPSNNDNGVFSVLQDYLRD